MVAWVLTRSKRLAILTCSYSFTKAYCTDNTLITKTKDWKQSTTTDSLTFKSVFSWMYRATELRASLMSYARVLTKASRPVRTTLLKRLRSPTSIWNKMFLQTKQIGSGLMCIATSMLICRGPRLHSDSCSIAKCRLSVILIRLMLAKCLTANPWTKCCLSPAM